MFCGRTYSATNTRKEYFAYAFDACIRDKWKMKKYCPNTYKFVMYYAKQR